ncbi:hypothetical protein RA280_32490 [Cupriavidus sp. CV2]|uniref:hypothetical protein n=1 Tax=Cupriavidus ulmosensis TaxID=3065913 RepID=UPI00296B4650|nr:hypothetical protein [Cupriavidus sp. CV2]MDW3686378.1 hypothetical protein [Cupriavidus sp. CV2]
MSDNRAVQSEDRDLMREGNEARARPIMAAKVLCGRGVLLLTTAAPGGIRFVQLAVFTALYGLTASGIAASAVNIAQLLGTVSAIGFCSLLLTRLPSTLSGAERRTLTGRLLMAMLMATAGLLAVGFVVALALAQVKWFASVSLLTMGWCLQQFARHVLISMRRFVLALVHDFVFMSTSLALFWLCRGKPFELLYFSEAFACCCALSIVVPLLGYRSIRGLFAARTSLRGDFRPGLGLGMNNLLSAAPSLLLVPAVSLFAGHATAGLIAFASNILNVLGLIPRAISINSLVRMVDEASVRTVSVALKRSIHRYLALAIPVFIMCIAYGFYASAAPLSAFEIIGSILLMLAFSLQQLALPVSNLLMKREKTAGPLLVGAVSSAAFLLICLVGYGLRGLSDLRLSPFAGVAVAGCVRYVLLMRQAKAMEQVNA